MDQSDSSVGVDYISIFHPNYPPLVLGDSLSEVTLYQLKTIVYNCAGLARSPLLCYMST